MKISFQILCWSLLVLGCVEKQNDTPITNHQQVRGWNLLSLDTASGFKAIAKTEAYNINHLQLSHKLIHDLKDIRVPEQLEATRKLMNAAKEEGVEKVFVWDHALYDLEYYPDEFKTEEGLIDLDNPGFWRWFKADYRSMLDSLPGLDGIILTFIETGAHVEDQHSEVWNTEAEKLAHLVDSLASEVIDERELELYVRTFIYYKEELDALLGCINLIQHPEIKVMTKEVPHDFFYTHPVSQFVTEFKKDVLIEFDLGHQFNGQGVIASILPEITYDRWKYYEKQENVIGYVARTDRYGDTQHVGRPTEINLYTLKRVAEDSTLSVQTIVQEFITQKYGADAVPILEKVFLETDEIISALFYTLGTNNNRHSRIQYEHQSSYSRHVSAKWLDDPIVYVRHGVNREFDLWKEVVEYTSPSKFKGKTLPNGESTYLNREAPWVIEKGWVTPADKMNLEYLGYILTEKKYAVEKASWALEEVRKAEEFIKDEAGYAELLQLYERTYLTAQLYLATSKAYFGYRVYLKERENEELNQIISEGLSDIQRLDQAFTANPHKGPKGQHHWMRDVINSRVLYQRITEGWDEYGNVKFTKPLL